MASRSGALFREIHGAGLADSKGWTEGQDYTVRGLPAGVIFKDLSKRDAMDKFQEITSKTAASGIDFSILKSTDFYQGLKMVWGH